jgi:hypothetical protein
MAGVRGDVLSDLPDDLRALLAAPPITEKKLLELSIAWADLPSGQARMAEALRLFVITWDPLEHAGPRPDAFATVNAGPPDLELVVYVPCWSFARLAAGEYGTGAGALGALAGSSVVTAERHEQALLSGDYPDLVTRGRAPDLLGDRPAGIALGRPRIRLVSRRWEDIGLGAITDIAQQAFGPVDLDRSPVELRAARAPSRGCPACAGRRFDFPADLAESREGMCPEHRREANAVINRRLAQANASNPDGWGALTDATLRQGRPHLPNGLATRLVGVEEAMYVVPEPDVLAERAQLVVEAAGWFPGRAGELALALGEEPEAVGRLPDWLVNLIIDLGRGGLGAEAAAVGDALARVDPDRSAMFAADVSVALAEAGLADQARARVAAMLTRWPADFWCRVHAGDAEARLGALDAADEHFRVALRMAEDTDDFEARSDAVERLRELRHQGRAGNEPAPRQGQRRQPCRKPSRSQRTRGARRNRGR